MFCRLAGRLLLWIDCTGAEMMSQHDQLIISTSKNTKQSLLSASQSSKFAASPPQKTFSWSFTFSRSGTSQTKRWFIVWFLAFQMFLLQNCFWASGFSWNKWPRCWKHLDLCTRCYLTQGNHQRGDKVNINQVQLLILHPQMRGFSAFSVLYDCKLNKNFNWQLFPSQMNVQIIVSINRFVVWSIKCQEMVRNVKCNLVTSSNSLFCLTNNR